MLRNLLVLIMRLAEAYSEVLDIRVLCSDSGFCLQTRLINEFFRYCAGGVFGRPGLSLVLRLRAESVGFDCDLWWRRMRTAAIEFVGNGRDVA
jgi:hypothetical protein